MVPEEFEALLGVLASAFPQRPISEATADVYEVALADLDYELTKRAVMRLVASEEWLPTVAKIRAAAYDLENGTASSGLEAWGVVCEAIRRVGYLEQPRFRDPLVAHVVESMGWRYLCKSPNDASDRARFVDLYETLSNRERTEGAMNPALRAPERRTALAAPRPRRGDVIEAKADVVRLSAITGKVGNGGRR